jgi:hypothetical protein
MFAIPIPLLIKAQLKRRRKIVLIGVMSLGLFTIIAAILNKFFNFASPLTTTYQIWYIREASTAIYVANLMCWWPLLRKLFGLKAFQYNSNRGQRGANQNNKNKDSNGYDTSSGSQSRPSFTFPRSWRPPCRRGIKDAPPVPQSDGRRSSTDPINRSQTYNTELIDDMQQVEAVPLEDWNKNDNISMRHSLNKAPSKQEDIADDYMHSESEYDSHYDSHLDRKRHTRSPC